MSAITNKLIFELSNITALTTRMQSLSEDSRPARAAISATRTRPKASLLRPGIGGWRLRWSLRRRPPAERAVYGWLTHIQSLMLWLGNRDGGTIIDTRSCAMPCFTGLLSFNLVALV